LTDIYKDWPKIRQVPRGARNFWSQ
jgi:hypothetical protein